MCGLLEIFEEDDGRRIEVKVRMPFGRIDSANMFPPVSRGKAAEVRQDEGDFPVGFYHFKAVTYPWRVE